MASSGPQAAIAFAGGVLDRADALRNVPERLAALRQEPARLLRLNGLEPWLGPDGALVWSGLDGAGADAELVFLGLDAAGRGCFAAVPDQAAGGIGPPSPQLWQAMADMPPGDLATYGTARSLVGWHARHRFCPRCGGGTVLAKGGWQRICVAPACQAEHFPRVDPVVIMTVEHGGDLLLGRQPRFPQGRYSALAGFVEPGESLEEAVAREVFEEAGLRVHHVRYVASQPWPFPASLMLAAHALAERRALTIDHSELEDARWFSRAQVTAAMRGDAGAAFHAPPRHAIAWHLLENWLHQPQPRQFADQPAG